MTRCLTASAFKRKGGNKRHAPLQEVPREGTKIRAAYDLLMANKGRPFQAPLSTMAFKTAVDQLQDFYGLDIRKVPGSRSLGRGSHGMAPATWLLAGEWFGRIYVDYVAERMEAKQ